MWVAITFGDLVRRLDADGSRELYEVEVDRRKKLASPISIAADGTGAWVSNLVAASVQRVEPVPKPPAKAKPARDRSPTGTP